MKKISKIIILVIIIAISIIITNLITQKIITNNINKKSAEITTAKNMYIKLETRHNYEKIIINEIYFKDNIILINNYENNILQTTDWKNTITGEKISYIYTLDEGILESNSFNDTLIEKIKSVVSIDNSNTSFLKKENNNYVYKMQDIFKKYYNSENYSLEKITCEEPFLEETYIFKFNTVTEEDVLKPSKDL
ncbi:MAG: hypothetical protein IKJ36_05485 [Clostridia bacterium]|jgi:hypothetical protein|nr:hypothetical protein [Clostridia bacterium]